MLQYNNQINYKNHNITFHAVLWNPIMRFISKLDTTNVMIIVSNVKVTNYKEFYVCINKGIIMLA